MRNGWRTPANNQFTPFYDVFSDAGGGASGGAGSGSPSAGAGGAAAGAAAGSSAGAGSGDAGSGASGTGSAGSGARTISDNDMVLIDGKAVRWGDARSSHYMPRSEYDKGTQFLMEMAKTMDRQSAGRGNGNAGQGRQQPQTQPQQQQRDPFADVENQAVIDGRTFAKFGRDLVQQGFGQIGQVIAQMGTRIQQLEQGTKGIGATVGSLAETHSNQEFESFISTTLKGVPEIPGLGTIPTDNELVREIAKDVFLSHDQKDPTLMKEFPRMVQERVTQLFKLFTTMQQQNVAAAKTNKRQFFNPATGGGRPTGQPKYVHENADQIARRFFEATGT